MMKLAIVVTVLALAVIAGDAVESPYRWWYGPKILAGLATDNQIRIFDDGFARCYLGYYGGFSMSCVKK